MNQPNNAHKNQRDHCPKQHNKGGSEKLRPIAAKQTKYQIQKTAVAVVVSMRKDKETGLQYISLMY
jgi:hypothetical protein